MTTIPTTRVIVMAKAPQPGVAKTRLIPALGAHHAAALAQKLLRHTVATALAAGVGPVHLCVTPAPHHAAWATFRTEWGVQWAAQSAGDLGHRMFTAAHRATYDGVPYIMIGTDCPALEPQHLRAMATFLATRDAVMIPATDGGYVAFGARRCYPNMYHHMTWSTHTVATITRQRLRAQGVRVTVFPELADVDVAEDLQHLPAGWLATTSPPTACG